MVAIRDEFMHPGPQPNGLQATKDGLWVIDQGDNHLYKLNYETGEILEKCATETLYSSGVTLGGGNIWISSTYSAEIFQCNFDGTTLAKYDTPGKGIAAFANPENQIVKMEKQVSHPQRPKFNCSGFYETDYKMHKNNRKKTY